MWCKGFAGVLSRRLSIIVCFAFLAACTHPFEITGGGDISSATGERDCAPEEPRCDFLIASDYVETYTARPRAGWEFVNWTRCGNPGTEPFCSFNVPSSVIEPYWFTRQPPVIANFAPVSLDLAGDSIAVEQALRYTDEESLPLHCSEETVFTADDRFAYSVSTCDFAINTFSHDPQSGRLTFLNSIVGDKDVPTDMRNFKAAVISPNGDFLYVSGSTGIPIHATDSSRSAIAVYAIDSASGELTRLQRFDDFAGNVEEMIISQDGGTMYTAGLNMRGTSVFRIGVNGLLSPLQFIDRDANHEQAGQFSSTDGSAKSNVLTNGGDQLYSLIRSRTGINLIAWYDVDPTSGRLTYVDQIDGRSIVDIFADGQTGKLIFSADNRHLYFAYGDGIEVFELQPNGSLVSIQSLTEAEGDSTRFFCLYVGAMSRNDRVLYINDSCSDELYSFERDTETGMLEFITSAFWSNNSQSNSDIEGSDLSQSNRATLDRQGDHFYLTVNQGTTIFSISADIELTLRDTRIAGDQEKALVLDLFNAGRSLASNVETVIELTDGDGQLALVSDSTGTRCESEANGLVCNTDQLAAGSAARIQLSVFAEAGATVVVQARATPTQTDSDPLNNVESVALSFPLPEEEETD